MDLSFIVPVRNDAVRLARCLDSIAAAGADDATEVIVADNGSEDDSARVAERAGARVLSLPDLRVSALRNAAAARARGTLLAFVDADHELAPGWVNAARNAMRDERIAAAGARYVPPPNGTWVQEMYGLLRGRTKDVADTDWLGSGNMVVRRTAFDRVGGFDASLEACEDVDLCRRLKEAGYRIIADERLISIHHGDPRTLGALFRAERWRGRDNLRVSLRGPLTLRDLPSIVIPIVSLLALITVVLAVVLGNLVEQPVWRFAAAAVLVIGALAVIRGVRMTANLSRPGLVPFAQAFTAALIYDTARAAALVSRAPHHRR